MVLTSCHWFIILQGMPSVEWCVLDCCILWGRNSMPNIKFCLCGIWRSDKPHRSRAWPLPSFSMRTMPDAPATRDRRAPSLPRCTSALRSMAGVGEPRHWRHEGRIWPRCESWWISGHWNRTHKEPVGLLIIQSSSLVRHHPATVASEIFWGSRVAKCHSVLGGWKWWCTEEIWEKQKIQQI